VAETRDSLHFLATSRLGTEVQVRLDHLAGLLEKELHSSATTKHE
jgi:hypothetical protein